MTGLYIHIPFCSRKCRYCGFNSRPAREAEVADYLRALHSELAAFARERPEAVDTVYIGGGTPTILGAEQFTALFDLLRRSYSLPPGAEITVEANPGTIDRKKALCLAALGVNRISLGVQSLQDSLLSRLGRMHSAREALEAFETLRRAGFENIGLDLIYAIPGQPAAQWEADLSAAIALGPEHLSLYALSIEKGTSFHRSWRRGTLALLPDEVHLEMYRLALEMASAAGYEHYEISNWARPGRRSRHNSVYWTMGDYYGAGAGAHSFFGTPRPARWANVKSPEAYIGRWRREKSPQLAPELLDRDTFLAEALMLGLRLREGIDLAAYRRHYGADPLALFGPQMNLGFERGWLELRDGRLGLTPDGILFSDEIFSRLFR